MTYKFSKSHGMNGQNTSVTQATHVMPRISVKNPRLRRMYRGLLASLGVTFLLVSASVQAANAPNLATSATYGVLSNTYTNTVGGTTINGDLGYTTGPAVVPTVTGATNVANAAYAAAGIDQGIALGQLNAQVDCISLGGGAVALNAINLGAGPGVFPPGCYTSGGAMDITVNTTVTLVGAGVYIFRPGGALTTGLILT